jgi:hypothetical protein
MPMSSDPPISAIVIAEKIAALRAEVAAAADDLARKRAELEWWETGERLFGETANTDVADDEGGEKTMSAPSNGTKPSLRVAILTVLGQEPRKTWKTDAVIEELRRRDWLPNGEYAEHHTRSMLAQMHRKGQARRVERGSYRLPPQPKGDP